MQLEKYKVLHPGKYRDYNNTKGLYPGQRATYFQAGETIDLPENYASGLVESGMIKPDANIEADTSRQETETVKPALIEVPKVPKVYEITVAAKKLAEQNDIDLQLITGTGSDGKIIKSDIVNYMEES